MIEIGNIDASCGCEDYCPKCTRRLRKLVQTQDAI